MDRGTCQAMVHGIAKRQTRLKWSSMHACALSNSFHDFTSKKVASTFYKFLTMVIKEKKKKSKHTHTQGIAHKNLTVSRVIFY